MKIRFTAPVELEVHESPTGVDFVVEKFSPGEITEIEICDDMQPPFAREIQFGDGGVAFVYENFWKSVDIDVATL